MTKKAFRAYLQANKDETFKRRTPFMCPLACYLGETYDEVAVLSASAEWRSRKTQRIHREELPQWAQEFIERVDDKPYFVTNISGAEALRLLDETVVAPALVP